MEEIKKSNRRTPYWKQIIYILTIGWIVIWIYRTLLTPIYPIISQYFGGASDAQLGNISSFYFLGYVCMQIPSGLLVDKLGKKQIMIPGFLLFGLGALIVGLAQNIGTVFLGSVLAGLGCGTYYGVAYSLTAEYVPVSKRSLATAIVNSGTAIGSGLGLISSSYLVRTGVLPWQILVFGSCLLILLAVLLFLRYIRLERPQKENDLLPERKETKPISIKSLVKPRMISAYILYFSTLYTYYLIDTWLPNFLETEKGFSGTSVGLACSLVFFTAIPGALIFSRFADRIPTKKVQLIILLELIAASVLFLTVTTTNQTVLVFGIMAYGFFGKLAVEPIIISWLGESAPKGNVATMYGVFNFFGMSASVIVPTVTGTISDITGSKLYAFYLAILIIIMGTFLFYLINRTVGEKHEIERKS
ncbi:MFS transporter [Candidatus Enterococcus mansonii]|uniref:Major facilitator superfamily (MFS) profile domain-containing protein n=1 Tax=Candidatus Enterococcus mansonii TaxID=1834181 RepID=A0A242C686_9ENTE|nr:MFS transporter [Enterococcus sp. 4G2_DIV0659]OTO05774.1 hypothetical protein A5880_002949 [Enterococcus sp. 4G2_DIV0659]